MVRQGYAISFTMVQIHFRPQINNLGAIPQFMNVYDLLINDKEKVLLDEVLLDCENQDQIKQLIREHKHINELSKYGLPVNNKILLHGSSGCGKTMTAKAIASSLGKNILILNLSNIVCSRIGETSKNLKQIFDKAGREKSVLFLDEFDQVGKARGNDEKDVGEMRRLVNTIIQLMDYFPENALLISERLNWRVSEFCEAFHMGRTKFYGLVTNGKLEIIKCGGTTVFQPL